MEKQTKDPQLRQYELLQYFADIAKGADSKCAGDIILHSIAEQCPPQYIEDIDTYICGKLVSLFEICLEGLQSIPTDRATPIQVKAALSHIGQYLADINDPKLKELKDLINGR